MSRLEILGIVTAIAIAIIGLVLGVICDPFHFSRSGALLVVIAIILGMFDLPHKLQKASIWFEGQVSAAKADAKKKIDPEDANPTKTSEAVEKAVNQTREQLQDVLGKKRRKAILTEGLILIAGTVIWGFGDLIAKAILAFQC